MRPKAVARVVSEEEVRPRTVAVSAPPMASDETRAVAMQGLSLVAVPDYVMVTLLELANRERKSVADLISEGLTEYLAKKGAKKPETVMRELGTLGPQEK